MLFFFRREVVLDVESLPDLLWRLALDHIRDGLAPDIEECLDVEVIRSLNTNQSSVRKRTKSLQDSLELFQKASLGQLA